MLFRSNPAQKSHFSDVRLVSAGRTDRRTHPPTEMRERIEKVKQE